MTSEDLVRLLNVAPDIAKRALRLAKQYSSPSSLLEAMYAELGRNSVTERLYNFFMGRQVV